MKKDFFDNKSSCFPFSSFQKSVLFQDKLFEWLEVKKLSVKESTYAKYYNIEKGETQTQPYGLICLFFIYAITVKLSVAGVLLFAVVLGIRLLKEKRWKEIVSYIGLGSIIIIPFLIRNVILTGYLLYPFSAIDIFEVDWKIPIESVRLMEFRTGLFSKLCYMGADSYEDVAGKSITEWFPAMIKYCMTTYSFEKITMILIFIVLTLTLVHLVLWSLLVIRKRKFVIGRWFTLKIVLLLSFVYCLLKAPDVRFLSFALFPLSMILITQYITREGIVKLMKYLHIHPKNFKNIGIGIEVICLLMILIAFKGNIKEIYIYMSWPEYSNFLVNPGYVYTDSKPWEYEGSNMPSGCIYKEDAYEEAEIDELKIYYQTSTTNFHFAWYDPFPALIMKESLNQDYGTKAHARGKSYKDGFYGEYVGTP